MATRHHVRAETPEISRERIDRIDARMRPFVERVALVTVPLCQKPENGPVTPAGSGVLLQVGTQPYLLTASHVFDNALPGIPLAAIAGRRFMSLSAAQRWRTKPGQGSSVDPADVAIVQLPRDHDEDWFGCAFLELGDIDPFGIEEEVAPTTSFLALGFPRTKQPKNVRKGEYAAFASYFLTHRETIRPENEFGGDPRYHIAVGYDRRGFVGSPGLSDMVHPEGMSGGGLWRVPYATTAQRPHGVLVGLLVEFHKKPRVILGSRIAEVLRFLASLTAANSEAIRSAFPSLDLEAT